MKMKFSMIGAGKPILKPLPDSYKGVRHLARGKIEHKNTDILLSDEIKAKNKHEQDKLRKYLKTIGLVLDTKGI